ncbi:hypothetical protein NHH03_22785 [Stieleria sp. TO1_6]|uniref:hypothetical protein n=1 Tax=Stieleria tagensis TaxID=2956795 RepID=UPI00209AF47A|nr:hypothetical protein [Stieleria tagensis]MCO8124583.1 hypothetical protein [Stieleria tagensis]
MSTQWTPDVKVGSSRFRLQTHEGYITQVQHQLMQFLLDLEIGGKEWNNIVAAASCGRVLRESDENARWTNPCRQTKYCRRCQAIERNAKAERFADNISLNYKNCVIWGIVITRTVSKFKEVSEEQTKIFGQILSRARRAGQYNADANNKPMPYAIGLHTKAKEDDVLWPHIHLMWVFDKSASRKKVIETVHKWMSPVANTGFRVQADLQLKVSDTLGDCQRGLDAAKIYNYFTRPDERDDGIATPKNRALLYQAAGINKTYTASQVPSSFRRSRSGYPNIAVQRGDRRVLIIPFHEMSCEATLAGPGDYEHLNDQIKHDLSMNFKKWVEA